MRPFDTASGLYDGDDLLEVIGFCARYGVVYSDDDVFLCCYKTNHSLVDTKSEQGVIENKYKKLDKPDTWYVYIVAGSLKKAFSVIEPMEYVAFRRFDKRFRLVSFERMRRLAWEIL